MCLPLSIEHNIAAAIDVLDAIGPLRAYSCHKTYVHSMLGFDVAAKSRN
jgi:hypothetical protein